MGDTNPTTSGTSRNCSGSTLFDKIEETTYDDLWRIVYGKQALSVRDAQHLLWRVREEIRLVRKIIANNNRSFITKGMAEYISDFLHTLTLGLCKFESRLFPIEWMLPKNCCSQHEFSKEFPEGKHKMIIHIHLHELRIVQRETEESLIGNHLPHAFEPSSESSFQAANKFFCDFVEAAVLTFCGYTIKWVIHSDESSEVPRKSLIQYNQKTKFIEVASVENQKRRSLDDSEEENKKNKIKRGTYADHPNMQLEERALSNKSYVTQKMDEMNSQEDLPVVKNENNICRNHSILLNTGVGNAEESIRSRRFSENRCELTVESDVKKDTYQNHRSDHSFSGFLLNTGDEYSLVKKTFSSSSHYYSVSTTASNISADGKNQGCQPRIINNDESAISSFAETISQNGGPANSEKKVTTNESHSPRIDFQVPIIVSQNSPPTESKKPSRVSFSMIPQHRLNRCAEVFETHIIGEKQSKSFNPIHTVQPKVKLALSLENKKASMRFTRKGDPFERLSVTHEFHKEQSVEQFSSRSPSKSLGQHYWYVKNNVRDELFGDIWRKFAQNKYIMRNMDAICRNLSSYNTTPALKYRNHFEISSEKPLKHFEVRCFVTKTMKDRFRLDSHKFQYYIPDAWTYPDLTGGQGLLSSPDDIVLVRGEKNCALWHFASLLSDEEGNELKNRTLDLCKKLMFDLIRTVFDIKLDSEGGRQFFFVGTSELKTRPFSSSSISDSSPASD